MESIRCVFAQLNVCYVNRKFLVITLAILPLATIIWVNVDHCSICAGRIKIM